MISSDFRQEARRRLTGKWGKSALITLVYFALSIVMEYILNLFSQSNLLSLITSIAIIAIQVPLAFGFMFAFLKLFNEEEVKIFDFLNLGFNNFKKSWSISFRIFLKMLVPFILTIISIIMLLSGTAGLTMATLSFSNVSDIIAAGSGILGMLGIILYIICIFWTIIKSYSYQLSYFISMENPEMLSKEVVEKSAELMKGKRGKLFILEFSFLGWIILSLFTLYIGFLWLIPYYLLAIISFYKFVIKENN